MNSRCGVHSVGSILQIAARTVLSSTSHSHTQTAPAASRAWFSSSPLCQLAPSTWSPLQCLFSPTPAVHFSPSLPWSPKFLPPSSTAVIARRIFFQAPIPSNYIDVPPNYKDEIGLPFRRQDLDAAECHAIFGPSLSPTAANKLLCIMHGRRVAGTLYDPAPRFQQNVMAFNKDQREKALAWLRKNVPVEEVVNAGLRAEDELKAIEEGKDVQLIENFARPVSINSTKYKLYKPREEEKPQGERPQPADSEAKRDGEDDKVLDVYGESVFDRVRAANEARDLAEIRRQEEEKRRLEEKQRLEDEEWARKNPGKLVRIGDRRMAEMSPRLQQLHLAAMSDLKAPPVMSPWARILPSALFCLVLVGSLVAFAEVSQPAQPELKTKQHSPILSSHAAATVLPLIGINLLVTLLWHIPPCWALLNKYAILDVTTPRPFSAIGSHFSHQHITHLVPLMFYLFFIGVRLHEDLGRPTFLATYISCGAIAHLASLTYLTLRGRLASMSLGASGAVYGIATAYFWLHRFDEFKILNFPPDPAAGLSGLGFLGMMLGVNICHAISPKGAKYDHAAHFSGMAVGFIAAEIVRRRRALEKEKEKEKKEKEEKQGGDAKYIDLVVDSR